MITSPPEINVACAALRLAEEYFKVRSELKEKSGRPDEARHHWNTMVVCRGLADKLEPAREPANYSEIPTLLLKLREPEIKLIIQCLRIVQYNSQADADKFRAEFELSKARASAALGEGSRVVADKWERELGREATFKKVSLH